MSSAFGDKVPKFGPGHFIHQLRERCAGRGASHAELGVAADLSAFRG